MVKKIIIGLFLIAVAGAGGFWIWREQYETPNWYAVHLTNGHVYFGKLQSLSAETIELANVHYLDVYNGQPQTSQSQNFGLQNQAAPAKIYQVLRRGDDAVIPTDHTLFINRASVLFWEKMDSASQVLQKITP